MPSASLLHWQNDRMPRLDEVEAQCAALMAAPATSPALEDENLRGYVLLLSAHFQGFCRDLYTECAQIIVSKVRATLQFLMQSQFTAGCRLDRGNPNHANIRKDFDRFGFTLDLAAADPANAARITHLGHLNKWRNTAAHHSTVPVGVPGLSVPSIQTWRISCAGLATSLDNVMYNQLRSSLRRTPW